MNISILEVIKILDDIAACDRSKPYEFGEARADGREGHKCAKYFTPRELAEFHKKTLKERIVEPGK